MATGETYDEFVNKFKPKLTTDDCYTPPVVYEAVKEWACDHFDITGRIVRPFYPGGDYVNYDYKPGDVVLDNPPFSILVEIVDFYVEHKIPFFLFAPAMTCLQKVRKNGVNAIAVGDAVTFENGAQVNISFLTSFGDYAIESAPTLSVAIRKASKEVKSSKTMLKYRYPTNVLTANDVIQFARKGIEFRVKRDELYYVRALDSQRPAKKAMFGGGFLISEKVAAEKAAAEKAIEWPLSERERSIISELSR